MNSEYLYRVKDAKTSMLVPLLLNSGIDSIQNLGSTRLTRSRRVLRDIDSSEEEEEEPVEKDNSSIQIRKRIKTSHIYSTLNDTFKSSLTEEILVPIKLDFEIDDFRIQDSFTWNLNESVISPEVFAEIMCTDLDLPIGPGLANEYISGAIYEQLEAHRYLIRQIQQRSLETVKFIEGKNYPPRLYDYSDFELRVPINLEVMSGQFILRDMIEWDLGLNPLPNGYTFSNAFKNQPTLFKQFSKLEYTKTPEYFSKKLCSELGIAGEFVPLIANSIREQILRFQKERLEFLERANIRKIKSTSNITPSEPGMSKTTSSSDLKSAFASSTNISLTRSDEFADAQANNSVAQIGLIDHLRIKNISTKSLEPTFLPELDNKISGWFGETVFRQKPVKCALRDITDAENWSPSLEVLSSEEIDKILLGQERSRR
ncbi:hypothetical protein BB560_006162 [Smittium megazygosporum]|uniref:Uncharacterized protein n=2 Tax=Smittium megazygosporum TaxID=133381 RepID=A0A2T9YF41_9FUNG|nr:hypothetical protein BB560_006162 [Smittium megazygosporum]